MPNSFFRFKQFIVYQDQCAMKVTTDACLFGSWAAREIGSINPGAGERTTQTILDIGSGTGLLSLMLVQQHSQLRVDAIEIDGPAFRQGSENIKASPWAERIKNREGDARSFRFEKKFDWIISNPPFYENELASPDEKKNQAHHGSGLPLDDLLKIIRQNLDLRGAFYLLLPSKRREEIDLLFKKNNLSVSKITGVRPSVHHPCTRLMIAGGINPFAQAEENEISIKDGKGEYSGEFVELLKGYYLKF